MPETIIPNDWETLSCWERNRLPGRSYFIPYSDEKAALNFERGNSLFFKLLMETRQYCPFFHFQ